MNRAVTEYGYTHLSRESTACWMRNCAQIFESVIGHPLTNSTNFKEIVKFLDNVNNTNLSYNQRSFLSRFTPSYLLPMRWYHKNYECVNLTPKQTAYFNNIFSISGFKLEYTEDGSS